MHSIGEILAGIFADWFFFFPAIDSYSLLQQPQPKMVAAKTNEVFPALLK